MPLADLSMTAERPPGHVGSSDVLGRTRTVAALFCRADSHYKALPAVDVWDEARDARQWPGGVPLVAHPPCRLWAKLRQFAKAKEPAMERQLAIDAVRRVQRFGGVLEHPAESTLWAHMGLPTPGRAPDQHGGWTAEIRQCDWGHKAEKLTWLYVVGCHPDDLPPMPPRGEPTGVIKPQRGIPRDGRKIVTKAEREHTPPELALWLVELARRCQVRPNLRWATRSENHADKVVHGTHNRGESHPLCKLTDDQVRSIRASSAKAPDIAAQYGVSWQHVRAIKTMKSRRWA